MSRRAGFITLAVGLVVISACVFIGWTVIFGGLAQ